MWHAQELTYAVAAPSARFGSLPAAYLRDPWHARRCAPSWLGARASLAPPVRTPPLDAGACFSQPAGGEIMIGGRKVVGSAQFRQGSALLQHGSILLEDNQSFVLGLTRGAIIARSPQRPAGLATRTRARPLRAGRSPKRSPRRAGSPLAGRVESRSRSRAGAAHRLDSLSALPLAAWTWAR